jgi:nucleotide-binding universal stress UspA family protein
MRGITMFKCIIWATDGSEAADTALPYVRSLALEHNAELILGHCDELLVARSAGKDEFIDGEYVRDKIERQAQALRDDGINAHAKFLGGIGCDAAKQIAETAEEWSADLIVVATRGRTALEGLLLGSVTQRLAHIAPCPVFVVPIGARGPVDEAAQAAASAVT